MLEIKNLCKSYGDKEVIRNITLQINKGEIISLLGSNGSGKTTTFKILASLLEADHGLILLNGDPIECYDVAYLPEERSLFNDITVYEHLKLIAELNRLDDIENRIERQLDYFNLKQYKNTKTELLSKGNKQKVALAVCLIKNASVVLLDEPFTGLDSSNVQIFINVIKSLKYHKKTVMLSSHIYQDVNQLCDRFLYLKNGKIKYDITKKELQDDKRRVIEVDEEVLLNGYGIINNYMVNGKRRYIINNELNSILLLNQLNCGYTYRRIIFEDKFYLD